MGAWYIDAEGDWRSEDELQVIPDMLYLELFQQARHAGQLESCARSCEPALLVPDIDVTKGAHVPNLF